MIFYLSSMPRVPVPFSFTGQDKLMHLLAFGVLGALIAHSFRSRVRNPGFKRVVLVALLVGLCGASDEIHQYFVPGRQSSLLDLAADTAGGFLAALVFWKRRLALSLKRPLRKIPGP